MCPNIDRANEYSRRRTIRAQANVCIFMPIKVDGPLLGKQSRKWGLLGDWLTIDSMRIGLLGIELICRNGTRLAHRREQ